eukprot:7166597-Prymnesium_polylepis.1
MSSKSSTNLDVPPDRLVSTSIDFPGEDHFSRLAARRVGGGRVSSLEPCSGAAFRWLGGDTGHFQ